MLGAFPSDSQADDGIQHRRQRWGCLAEALRVADFRQEFERPDTRWFAKVASALMWDRPQLAPFRGVQHGLDSERDVQLTLHTSQDALGERMEHIPYGLRRTVQGLGDHWGFGRLALANKIWQLRTVNAS
jgi:hypothetical protein